MTREQRANEVLRYEVAPNAWLEHYPAAIEQSASLFERACAELDWHEESYQMFGREVRAPRLVAWHGDAEATYRYSGIVHAPAPWTPCLQSIRASLQSLCGLSFNAVLANWYRTGGDSMGWHADREKEIGPSPADRQIASVSLGARRRFLVRTEASGETLEFSAGEGDVLVMRGRLQEHCKHAIPKTKKAVGARVNLSFRNIVV